MKKLNSYVTKYDFSQAGRGCKGICKLYYETHTIQYGTLRLYLEGWRRCSACSLLIRYNGLYCPCCGIKLATRPSSGPARRRFLRIRTRARSAKLGRQNKVVNAIL